MAKVVVADPKRTDKYALLELDTLWCGTVWFDVMVLGINMGDTARSKCKNSRLVTAITWSLAVGGCADGTGPELTRVTEPTESPEVTVIRQASAWPGAAGLFIGKDLSHPKVVALQPLVAEILSAYGNPHDNLGRARVLRDWVARTAIHPHMPFHPDGSSSNLAVLPVGRRWAEVNPVAWAHFDSDSEFWHQWLFDGYGMLDQLLGTLDPRTGVRANDGMMTHVQGAQYRIKDISDYHYVLCTYQDFMLISLWEAAGLHGLLLSTIRHDPAAVFIPELAKWVYMDPTYNEEFTAEGSGPPLSPLELLDWSMAGEHDKLRPRKLSGPDWSPDVYISTEYHHQATYFADGHPDGMVVMGSQLNNSAFDSNSFTTRLVQVDTPRLPDEAPFNNSDVYTVVAREIAFPDLGVAVWDVSESDGHVEVLLLSTFPHHTRYQRSVNDGPWEKLDWVTVAGWLWRDGMTVPPLWDQFPAFARRVVYRSVDASGNHGIDAIIEVN